MLRLTINLKWTSQLALTTNKISRCIGMLRYAKQYLPISTVKTMYRSLVEPYFRYCCPVWGTAGVTVIEKLQKPQNRAAKLVSSLLCAFRNGHSTQHALFRLIETCRKTLDEKAVMGMVLMDLSKAYDCLSHDLLIAKLAAYGFGPNSLALISNYLSQRKQRIKVGSTFSEWQEILSGVPQGSVLGPLFFNVFAMKSSHVCNFADDNTVYACDKAVESVAMRL